MPDDQAPIDEPDKEETPSALAGRWNGELKAAMAACDKWWIRGEKVIKRYLDDRSEAKESGQFRLNLFTANTQTMESLLFGKTPQVDVARRFADSEDDEARVASEILERLLNMDIERDDDTQQEAMRNALSDRLRTGLGNVRLRYEIGDTDVTEGSPAILHPVTQQELAPAVPGQETRPDEDVCVDYVYWKDQLWSPCRTHAELRWWAFKAEMSGGGQRRQDFLSAKAR